MVGCCKACSKKEPAVEQNVQSKTFAGYVVDIKEPQKETKEFASAYDWSAIAPDVQKVVGHLEHGLARIDGAIAENRRSFRRTNALWAYRYAAKFAVVALKSLHEALEEIELSV